MDLRQLLLCIRDTKDTPINQELLRDALKTVMSICSKTASAKDTLRGIGGLSCLIDYVCSTSNAESLEYGLKTLSCAVDQNAQNQYEVTKNDVFILIRNTLAREDLTPSLLKSAVLLISTILYQNAIAQNIFRETGCLQCCVDLYQEVFPPFMLGHVSVKIENSDLKLASTGIWQAVNTALCFSMTNPVNSCNQERCARLIPVALKILQCSSYHEILSSITGFLSALIIDNGRNLSVFVKQDGLSVLKYCLEVGVMSILANNAHVGSKGDVQATVSIISLIDLCIVDNEENARILAQSGAVSLLTKMLFIDALGDSNKTKVLLTLGHFIEAGKENIKPMLAEGNLKTFFRKNSRSSNDDLLKSCQYVIHLLLLHGQFGNTANMDEKPQTSNSNQKWQCDWSMTSASCVTEFQAKRARTNGNASPSSSSSSDDVQSHIELSRTKEERVRQYLQELSGYSAGKTGKPSSIATGTDKKHFSTSSLLSKSKKVSYFNAKFGSHQSISQLSVLTNSEVNTARAQCSSHKSWSFSGASSRLNPAILNQCDHRQFSFSRYDCNSCFHNNKPECCGHENVPCCNRIVSRSQSCQVGSMQRDKRYNVGCNHVQQMTGSDVFLMPTDVMSTSRSIAVQMPTPVVEPRCQNVATSTNTPSLGWRTTASKVSVAKFSSAGDSAKEKRKLNDDLSCNKTFFFNDRCHSKYNDDCSRKDTKQRKSSLGGQTLSFSPFEKDTRSYMGSLVNVLRCSPAKGTAASRLAAKVRKQQSEQEASTSKGNTSASNSEDTEPYFDVLVFPSMKCPEHGLISSQERLWFKPIEDK